jgi:hypothetical protein
MKNILSYMAIPIFVVIQSGCSTKSDAYKKINTIFIEERKSLPTRSVDCYVSNKQLQKAYYGKCVNGKAEGFGRALGNGESEYIGYFKDGKLNGQGFYYNIGYLGTSDTYIGYFKNDEIHGKGTLYSWVVNNSLNSYASPSGEYYTGNFENGNLNGFPEFNPPVQQNLSGYF